jgi:hypothetical protein
MKKTDPNNSSKKSISNLEDQSINADKVQGGLKVASNEIVAKREGFRTHEDINETKPLVSGSDSEILPNRAAPSGRKYRLTKASK